MAKKLCAGLEPGYRVLEVGCGTGGVLSTLSKACAGGIVVGVERYFSGLPLAQKRFCRSLVQGDARQLPFGKGFHLVGMFDVLEHIPEEDETLYFVARDALPRRKAITDSSGSSIPLELF